jgi:hypothetical protein
MKDKDKDERGAQEDERDSKDERDSQEESGASDVPDARVVLVAFEKLFAGGRGVRRTSRTRLRFVELEGGAVLMEQNPSKRSEWGELARAGRRVAWVMRDGRYLARVVDGEFVALV